MKNNDKFKNARDYFKGINFMTPRHVKSGFAGAFAYEISAGENLSGNEMYGVSLADRVSGERSEREYNLSKCFNDISQALRYVDKTIRKIK